MRPFGLCLMLALTGPVAAQEQPLSVIDWLGRQEATVALPAPPATNLDREEPAITFSALPPKVTVTPLGEGAARAIGLVPPNVTGLPGDLWAGSEPGRLVQLIEKMPDLTLPAAQSLFFTLLLAETSPPGGDAGAGDLLALARVEALMRQGAVDPALALIEQADPTKGRDHFDLWMELSLLAGSEDRPCATLRAAPHLSRDYATSIFCAVRAQDWENAALTLGSARALELMPDWKLELLDRFLNPDYADGLTALGPPRQIDPLSFRLFEALGEPLPTGTLPRAYATADLRDLAGWKAQVEAAERLARAGALPDNRLLGLYSERRPAASGGVWDRVRAFQNLDTALSTGSTEAIAKTLPTAWDEMLGADMAPLLADLVAERLSTVQLTGRAEEVRQDLLLLSPDYEAAAAAMAPNEPLAAIARGQAPEGALGGELGRAIRAAFSGGTPRAELLELVQQGRLGEAILRTITLLQEGTEGDPSALTDALSTLRAIGLEDSARRAALQLLILRN
ncbi:MAG: hypothetical protein P1U53_07835 [Sulfitobacter sp.]|nr:hypothetical protein [Sulfitobacter sp.]